MRTERGKDEVEGMIKQGRHETTYNAINYVLGPKEEVLKTRDARIERNEKGRE